MDNGGRNYETQAVHNWLLNDEYMYNRWIDAAESESTYELARQLKDDYEDNSPLVGESGVYADLLGGALSNVDWNEIAESLKEACDNE